MGKVHINSEKQNRKKVKDNSDLLILNPIPLIGPGVVESEENEQSLTPEVITELKEIAKTIYIEKPIEIIKEVIIEKPIEKYIEVIKEVQVSSEPVIQYIDRIIEVPKIEIKEISNDYELIKKQNKLLKILVPILAVVAIIGLII